MEQDITRGKPLFYFHWQEILAHFQFLRLFDIVKIFAQIPGNMSVAIRFGDMGPQSLNLNLAICFSFLLRYGYRWKGSGKIFPTIYTVINPLSNRFLIFCSGLFLEKGQKIRKWTNEKVCTCIHTILGKTQSFQLFLGRPDIFYLKIDNVKKIFEKILKTFENTMNIA